MCYNRLFAQNFATPNKVNSGKLGKANNMKNRTHVLHASRDKCVYPLAQRVAALAVKTYRV